MTPIETLRALAQTAHDAPPHDIAGGGCAWDDLRAACDPQTILALLADLDAARARIAAREGHVLTYPPHPNWPTYWLSSALCSCGDFQYDADSVDALMGRQRDVWRAWTEHIAPPSPKDGVEG